MSKTNYSKQWICYKIFMQIQTSIDRSRNNQFLFSYINVQRYVNISIIKIYLFLINDLSILSNMIIKKKKNRFLTNRIIFHI